VVAYYQNQQEKETNSEGKAAMEQEDSPLDHRAHEANPTYYINADIANDYEDEQMLEPEAIIGDEEESDMLLDNDSSLGEDESHYDSDKTPTQRGSPFKVAAGSQNVGRKK
jgi:hypothetical protein